MIEIITNQYNSLIILLICAFFFPIYVYLGARLNISYARSSLLLFWHSFFSLIYFIYTFYYISDAKVYFIRSLSYETSFFVGSTGIDYIISLLRKNLNFQYLTIFLIFSLIGSLGLLFFDSTIKISTKNSSPKIKKILSLIVLLPSISFWSSAIGKDSIAFLSVTLFLYSFIELKNRNILFYISFLLMFFVRPHIAIFFLISGLVYYLFSNNSFTIKSIFNTILLILFLIFVLPFSLQYAGVISTNDFWSLDLNLLINKVLLFTEHRQSLNLFGGSSVNIKDMSTFERIFTYFFRPQLYEAHNVYAFVSSMDNLVILILFIFWIYNIIYFMFTKKIIFIKLKINIFLGVLLYVIFTSLILSATTANLGIAVRQKWMILPLIIYLIIISTKSLHYENTDSK